MDSRKLRVILTMLALAALVLAGAFDTEESPTQQSIISIPTPALW